MGESVEDVVSECVEIAEQIKGDQLKTFPEALKSAQEALDELAECGVKL